MHTLLIFYLSSDVFFFLSGFAIGIVIQKVVPIPLSELNVISPLKLPFITE